MPETCPYCGKDLSARPESYTLWAIRGSEWTTVGQYRYLHEAERIAADYRSRGERVKIEHPETRGPVVT